MDTKYQLPGGTTRSERSPLHHLVPPSGPRRIAQRFTLGADTHGVDNWKKSLGSEGDAAAFCQSAYDHMMEHMLKMVALQDPEDDHLGAIGWAVCTLAHVESLYGKKWTELRPEATT
jgi:hypothetical protein